VYGLEDTIVRVLIQEWTQCYVSSQDPDMASEIKDGTFQRVLTYGNLTWWRRKQTTGRAKAGHTSRVFPLLTITATLSFSQLSIVVVLPIRP